MEKQQKTRRGLNTGGRGEAPATAYTGAESKAVNSETQSPSATSLRTAPIN